MSDVITNVLTVAAVAVTGAGSVVDTLREISGGQRTPPFSELTTARFYLNVSVLTGGTPTADVTIVATINAVEHVIGTFAQATGVTKEFIDVVNCPGAITAKYAIGGTTPVFTATVDCVRTYAR